MATLQELDSSEKQWVEVCGQIDKLDKFFPLSAVAMSKAREAQAAAIARGDPFCCPSLYSATKHRHFSSAVTALPVLACFSYTCMAAVNLSLM